MQTSGNGSSMTTRVAGVAAAIGLAIVVTSSWIACSPGEPDCGKVNCDAANGGNGGTAGSGGGEIEKHPASCEMFGVMSEGTAALTEFETSFIATKCGTVMCHGPSSVFPPRDLDKVAKIRPNLAGVKAQLNCKTDYYIAKGSGEQFMKSYILAKITSDDPKNVDCPSGGMGGTRMPNKDMMPTIPGDKLPDPAIECFTWYVKAVAQH
jgi:hypothetical protein